MQENNNTVEQNINVDNIDDKKSSLGFLYAIVGIVLCVIMFIFTISHPQIFDFEHPKENAENALAIGSFFARWTAVFLEFIVVIGLFAILAAFAYPIVFLFKNKQE